MNIKLLRNITLWCSSDSRLLTGRDRLQANIVGLRVIWSEFFFQVARWTVLLTVPIIPKNGTTSIWNGSQLQRKFFLYFIVWLLGFRADCIRSATCYQTENKCLCCYQSGFRTLHSTVTALIEAIDSWSLNIDCGFVNVSLLRLAFDAVR